MRKTLLTGVLNEILLEDANNDCQIKYIIMSEDTFNLLDKLQDYVFIESKNTFQEKNSIGFWASNIV